MALSATPRFGDPDGVSVAWVLSDAVAQAAGHAVKALKQDQNQCITLLADQLAHA